MSNKQDETAPRHKAGINIKIFPEWFNFFDMERSQSGTSLSLQMRYALVEVLSSMQKPFSAKDIDRIQKNMQEVKMSRGGRDVARGLKIVKLYLGPITSLEIRQIAKDNDFELGSLLRALLNIYLTGKNVDL